MNPYCPLGLEPECASKLKHTWLYREVPEVIAKQLKLPAAGHALTWRDISTFTGLGFGVCRGFAFGIICSTIERI